MFLLLIEEKRVQSPRVTGGFKEKEEKAISSRSLKPRKKEEEEGGNGKSSRGEAKKP